MTPKEKCDALITNFRYARDDGHEEYVARRCAQMCVEEIIATGALNDESSYVDMPSYLGFWENVLSEIKKLQTSSLPF